MTFNGFTNYFLFKYFLYIKQHDTSRLDEYLQDDYKTAEYFETAEKRDLYISERRSCEHNDTVVDIIKKWKETKEKPSDSDMNTVIESFRKNMLEFYDEFPKESKIASERTYTGDLSINLHRLFRNMISKRGEDFALAYRTIIAGNSGNSTSWNGRINPISRYVTTMPGPSKVTLYPNMNYPNYIGEFINEYHILDELYGKHGEKIIGHIQANCPFTVTIDKMYMIKSSNMKYSTMAIDATITPKMIYKPRPVEEFIKDFHIGRKCPPLIDDVQLVREFYEYSNIVEPVKPKSSFSGFGFRKPTEGINKAEIKSFVKAEYRKIGCIYDSLMELLEAASGLKNSYDVRDIISGIDRCKFDDTVSVINGLDKAVETLERKLDATKKFREDYEEIYKAGKDSGSDEKSAVTNGFTECIYKAVITDPTKFTDEKYPDYIKDLAKKLIN